MGLFKDIALIGKASAVIESLEKECNQLKFELQNLEISLANSRSENLILLAQLDDFNSQIENIFLECHKYQEHLEFANKNLKKVLEDNPSYFGYDQINFELDQKADRGRWKISNLIASGRFLGNCEFDTFIEQEMIGLIFRRKINNASPLKYWPKDFSNDIEIELIPTGTIENAHKRAQVLKSISTTDWQFLKILLEILIEAIKNKKINITNGIYTIEKIQKTQQILFNQIPNLFRFDEITLNRILVHPGYEHLSFEVKNLLISHKNFPKFEFRLGCSNINLDKFGLDPKLEFPLTDEIAPFESWFAESEDEFGPKLELRFAQPDAMDLDVWGRLSASDKKIIEILISNLEKILYLNKNLIDESDRSLEEWIAVSKTLNRIMKIYV